MTDHNADCRRVFEREFSHLDLTRYSNSGGYSSKITNRTWQGFQAAWKARAVGGVDDSTPLLPPWFDIAIAPKNGATILGMYAAKESFLGDDGPRHHIVRWFDSENAFCTIDGKGDPERQPTLTHWQPLTYLHVLYGHTVYPVQGAYYAYPLPDEWRQAHKPDHPAQTAPSLQRVKIIREALQEGAHQANINNNAGAAVRIINALALLDGKGEV